MVFAALPQMLKATPLMSYLARKECLVLVYYLLEARNNEYLHMISNGLKSVLEPYF